MGLFSCGEARKPNKARKPSRPVISRPLEADRLRDGYHARDSRTAEGLLRQREAETRRRDEEQSTQRRAEVHQTRNQRRHREHVQRASQIYPAAYEQYPSMQEVECHERYGPRGREERYVRANTPPFDDRWQGAYDQLNRKVDKAEEARTLRVVNRTPDQWARDDKTVRPGPSRPPPRAEPSRPQRRPDAWNSDAGLARPENIQPSPHSSIRAGKRPASSSSSTSDSSDDDNWRRNYNPYPTNLVGARDGDNWMQYSSIARGYKHRPAPKDGKRVLYNCDDATATRRNMGW